MSLKNQNPLDAPIFLVGMGRSGSTLLFECLATHNKLGWLSHHTNRMPHRPELHLISRLCDVSLLFRKSIERSDQRRRILEKMRLGPAEAYETWTYLCGSRFRSEYLLDTTATPEEQLRIRAYIARSLRWSGKQRLVAKLTGPPRIRYLHSIFPDAIFVHVVRDGRAVARSLLLVDFWRNTFRMWKPAWINGFPPAYEQLWRSSGCSPIALAALQWRNVVEITRREGTELGGTQYLEIRYEDFLASPRTELENLLDRFGLQRDPRVFRFLAQRFEIRNMNEVTRATASSGEETLLERLIGTALLAYGYSLSTPANCR